MQRSHKIKLNPNNKQVTYFKQACGTSRFVYNWALAEWESQYKAGLRPSAYSLKKKFNSIKKAQFPWVYNVTKCAPEQAFNNLNSAFKKFFKKQARYPRLKKKGQKQSFYISNDKILITAKSIRIPKLGWVRMHEPVRSDGRVVSATVSCTAGMWFVSINVKVHDIHSESQARKAVGIDLGLSHLAVLSDGTIYPNIKTTKKYERRLRRLNKSLARKKKGSSNRHKAKIKLSKLHYKIKCIRANHIHEFTSEVSKNYTDVCLEDLHTKGMLKNRRLAKSLSDASFYEIRRQLDYKTVTHYVDRFFPSTKLCMDCGQVYTMPLNRRTFRCTCGAPSMDRDLHAAQNILRQGLPDYKPVESGQLWLN